MAAVPEHQRPQQGAGGKQAYQPQQRKPGEQQPASNEGYVRLHMHVANGQMSVTGAQAVAGPLVQPQSLQHEHAYEATVGANRVAAESIPDLTERRSYPNPQGGPGHELHYITHASIYDFIVRIPRNTLSLTHLPHLSSTHNLISY